MVDILAFGAHPDDIEFGCGGILLREYAAGHSIALCDLTLGDKATHGTPQERRQEGLAAAALLDAERFCLGFGDCELADTLEMRSELVRVIRKTRPTLVLAPLWWDTGSHPDHAACGKLARAACRLARFPAILPDDPVHTPAGILHYLMPWEGQPDLLIDITAQVDRWKEMIGCHTTQLQSRPYLDWCLRAASGFGHLLDVPYAQGLSKGNPLVIDNLLGVAQGTREL